MAKWVRKRFDLGTLGSPDEKPFRHYGQAIRHFREAARLTQEQLALAIDGHNADISRLETGDANPEFSTLSNVADGLGVSIAQIFSLGDAYAGSGKKPKT
jgi:transcriptional regulator with XRE-family HTH domain